MKKICGWEKSDNGIFWIDIEDFKNEFEVTSVNFVNENYFYAF